MLSVCRLIVRCSPYFLQCWLSCKSIQLSMTLERNDRLLTDLKFELINSKPSFLSNGHTTAVFHFLMNNPSHRETLTILVMSGRIVGSSVLKMSIGMTSSSQDLLLRELMTLKTSSSDMGANSSSFWYICFLWLVGCNVLEVLSYQ